MSFLLSRCVRFKALSYGMACGTHPDAIAAPMFELLLKVLGVLPPHLWRCDGVVAHHKPVLGLVGEHMVHTRVATGRLHIIYPLM